MLVYGIIANVSISALFTAGFVPGALVGTCLMFTAYTIARRHGYKARCIPTRWPNSGGRS